ncbi:20996_t:CDS:2 [Entrophospora sp. SA101]|nr:20996_t:CDS:2 [Entrophospora sp. SA101]
MSKNINNKKVLAEKLKSYLNAPEYVAVPDLIKDGDYGPDLVCHGNGEIEITKLIKRRNEERKKNYQAKIKKIEDKIKNQPGLFYYYGEQSRNQPGSSINYGDKKGAYFVLEGIENEVGDKITITPYQVETNNQLPENPKRDLEPKGKTERYLDKDGSIDYRQIKFSFIDCYASHKDPNGQVLQQQNCSHCQPWKHHEIPNLNNKEVIDFLINYFQEKNIKKIKLVNDELVIEYNDNKNFSSAAKTSPENQTLKKYLIEQNIKELTRQELRNRADNTTSNKAPNDNKREVIVNAANLENFYQLEPQQKVIYLGIDCTGERLHIGHLFSLIQTIRFAKEGFTVLLVLGGATSKIGDPSDKLQERPQLATEKLNQYYQAIKDQVTQIVIRPPIAETKKELDFAPLELFYADNPQLLSNIYQVLKIKKEDISFIDFISQVGRNISINYLLAKETIKQRVNSETGLSFLAFNYSLLQAYDFYYLYQNYNCHGQLGGSDQWGNLTTGLKLIRGNQKDFYDFFRNMPDEQAKTYLKQFTFLTEEQIAELVKLNDPPKLRIEKIRIKTRIETADFPTIAKRLSEISNVTAEKKKKDIKTIELILSNKLAGRVMGLIELKDALKDDITAGDEVSNTHFWVELNEIEYDKSKGIVDNTGKLIISAKPSDVNAGKVSWLTGDHSDDAKKLVTINASNINQKADEVEYKTEDTGIFNGPRDALLALEDKLDGMKEHYTKDEGDIANRDIDADLTFLEKYNDADTTSNEQKVYVIR